MKLPQYTKQDLWIMTGVLIPWIVIINYLMLGNAYFSTLGGLFAATLISFTVKGTSWQFLTWIAITLRERLPEEKDDFRRVLFAIFLFVLITGLVNTLLYWFYDKTDFLNCEFNAANYRMLLVISASLNVFVAFLHEGVLRFEKWKSTIIENEQLKKEYMRSQLLGLKSQINPHFLFNSLNSLSSLINEDEKEAEKFLDEMSKVYRYLLRNNEEELVALQTELSLIQSYFYLLKVRHGKSLELEIEVTEADRQKMIPPLTLQMLLENVLNSNVSTKDRPILIQILSSGADRLEIRNNVARKHDDPKISENMQNITKKFRLLCQREVEVVENGGQSIIRIPLIHESQMKVA